MFIKNMNKKIDYKCLAESYEELLDIKNEVIEECEADNVLLRKQLINHKIDRITLTVIILILLIGIIIK